MPVMPERISGVERNGTERRKDQVTTLMIRKDPCYGHDPAGRQPAAFQRRVHSEGLKKAFPEKRADRLSGYGFHDGSDQAETEIGIVK